MSESGKNRRDRAAAAREAANAGEKRRERIVRIVGAITVLVVVVGIIGVAVVVKNQASNEASTGTSTASADPNAALPETVLVTDDPYAFGVPYGTATADAPILAIWEDFQCPACDAVEEANGAGITQLAEEGKVQLIYRPTTFLDANLGNDSSERAVAAWGCAIDAGKTKEYHNAIFNNQPEVEGTGYSDDTLIGFASEAGITGADLDTFTTCFNDRKYLSWAANSSAIFYASGVGGTPSATINGVDVPTEILANKEALDNLVAEVTAASAASPAPSPSAS
jgi:protein-disulfide isomerase